MKAQLQTKAVRFLLIGGATAALNFLLLFLLVNAGIPYLWACAICFFVLNILSYRLNRSLTFRPVWRRNIAELFRYYAVMTASLFLNLALMYTLVDLGGAHYLVASATISLTLATMNFLGHYFYSFRPPDAAKRNSHILQISAFYPSHGGGIEVVAGKLAEEFARGGTRIIWMAGYSSAEELPGGHPNLILSPQGYCDPLGRRTGLPFPVWKLASYIRIWRNTSRADLVHLHDYLYVPCIVAAACAKIHGKPVVITQHIGQIPFSSKWKSRLLATLNLTLGRLMLASADQVVFVSPSVMEYFSSFLRFGTSPVLIPNGVDHATFHPAKLRAPRSRTIRLLFVGRFVEKKGVELLRDCVALPDTEWQFVGRGPLTPRRWDPPSPNVRVFDQMPPEQLASFYQDADLLVLPSQGEGFPLVVQESLACGTPVLVGSEVARSFPRSDGACVFEVNLEQSDPGQELRDVIKRLASEPETLTRARGAAVALATQWSWKTTAQRYGEVYGELISG